MKYFVYHLKRTKDDEHPFYIGLTRDPETRSLAHRRKHGMSTQFVVLHEFDTEEEAISKETELIELHSKQGNILNLRGVKGTRQARKGLHQILVAQRAERKRLRAAAWQAALSQHKRAQEEGRQRQTEIKTAVKSVGSVAEAFVVLRGLLTGVPTPKETALHALEVIRLAPGAMELARVYIKANIT